MTSSTDSRMDSPMNNPMPSAQPAFAGFQRRKKVRPFSLVWGLLFLALGSAGFASGTGIRPGPMVSITFILGSCLVLYLIVQQRKEVQAAASGTINAGTAQATASGAATPTATPPASPGDELFQEALAELDSVDYTVASPEQILSNDSTDPGQATGSTEAG